MYILVRVDDSFLEKALAALKRLKVWYKLFEEKMYDVIVTAEDRVALKHRHFGSRGNLNPPGAWKTCRSCRQIWDKGPGGEPLDGYEAKRSRGKAPAGKGWIPDGMGGKKRVAGDCANPEMLNTISCPMWCTKYEPTTIEGSIFLAERVIEAHQERIDALKQHIALLKRSESLYEEVAKTGGIIEYKDGRFETTDLPVP